MLGLCDYARRLREIDSIFEVSKIDDATSHPMWVTFAITNDIISRAK